MKEEIWKEINEYPNYMVSNMGNVKSLNYRHTGREKILKTLVDKRGYLYVGLWKNGTTKNYLLHRLVAQAFIQNPNNYPQVNHKDENKQNNCVKNLEYCDAKYNSNYGTRNKRIAEKNKGMKHTEEAKNKISEAISKQVLQIDQLTDTIIAEFPSIMEVERQLGFSNSTISRCCKGKLKQSHGFKWKYK